MSSDPKIRIRIAAQGAGRELDLELDMSADELAKMIDDALEKGVKTIDLSSTNGSRVVIPADKIAFIQISEVKQKSVGFG